MLFGPGQPAVRDWTSRPFPYSGYTAGFTRQSPSPDELPALRHQLGYRDDEL